MPDFRGDIRRAIFRKLRKYEEIDIKNDVIAISKILGEYSKRYENFDQDERLNIELTVPIQIPPNGKAGDCKAVVLKVQAELNKLGGGSRLFSAEGSLLDDEGDIVPDYCVVVFSAMPIVNWYTSIPILKELIQDEIQTKLSQECVFLRIDNQTFGEPLNLLGEKVKDFPKYDLFGDVDPECDRFHEKYVEQPIATVLKQNAIGEGINQLAATDHSTAALGSGAVAAGRDIIIHAQDPETIAMYKRNIQLLEDALENTQRELEESKKQIFALEASKQAEEILQNEKIEFTGWKLIEVSHASKIAGRTEFARTLAKQALEIFKSNSQETRGVISCNILLGDIALRLGENIIAENHYDEAYVKSSEIKDFPNIAKSLGSLANLAHQRGELSTAAYYFEKTLTFFMKVKDFKNAATSYNNLGLVRIDEGKDNIARELFIKSLELTQMINYTKVKQTL